MAKKESFYAVKVGKVPGIYKTWNETKLQTDGFSGAIFEKFNSLSEAEEFLHSQTPDSTVVNSLTNDLIEDIIKNSNQNTVNAFTDGSFDSTSQKYSFGAILKFNNKKITLFKSFVDKDGVNLRNFAGEMKGAIEVIGWAIDNKFETLNLFYDYEGIEKFANGQFKKPTNQLSKDYMKLIKESKNKITINFYKIKSHSGITLNDEADALAKAALTSNDFQTKKDGSVSVSGITLENWLETIKTINNNLEDESSHIKFKIRSNIPTVKQLLITQETDRISIMIYHNIKSYVQGSLSPLLETIISSSSIYLDSTEKFTTYLNSFHAIIIEPQEIIQLYIEKYPHVQKDKLDQKLQIIYDSSLYHYLISANMPDYRSLLTPIFLVIESLLHEVLGGLGNITSRNGRNNFAFFTKNPTDNLFYYNKSNSLSEEELNLLNQLYNYYYSERHKLSHWNINSFDSAMLTNINTTRDLMNIAYALINQTHLLFY